MAAVMAESALALSINATLGRHVPRVHLFADSSRIDNDLAQLTNLSPYKLVNSSKFIKKRTCNFQIKWPENSLDGSRSSLQYGKYFVVKLSKFKKM